MARGRDEATCVALHPTQVNVAEALRGLNHDIKEFKPSAVTTEFLSQAATQTVLVTPMHKFISTTECIQSDYIGDATNYTITIDDARGATGERGTMPMARQIALNKLIEETQQITAFHQHKLTAVYEEVTAMLRNAPIEGKYEKILFGEIIKYLQVEKNVVRLYNMVPYDGYNCNIYLSRHI